MHRILPTLALSGILLLAGCTNAPDEADTPSTPSPAAEEPDANAVACAEVRALLGDISQKITDDSTQDDWEQIGEELDRIGLRAEGVVQERILSLSENWPSLGEVMFGETTLVEDTEAIVRACGG